MTDRATRAALVAVAAVLFLAGPARADEGAGPRDPSPVVSTSADGLAAPPEPGGDGSAAPEPTGVPAPPPDPFGAGLDGEAAPPSEGPAVGADDGPTPAPSPEEAVPSPPPRRVSAPSSGIDDGIVIGVLLGAIGAIGLGITIGVLAAEGEGIAPATPGTLGVVVALQGRL